MEKKDFTVYFDVDNDVFVPIITCETYFTGAEPSRLAKLGENETNMVKKIVQDPVWVMCFEAFSDALAFLGRVTDDLAFLELHRKPSQGPIPGCYYTGGIRMQIMYTNEYTEHIINRQNYHFVNFYDFQQYFQLRSVDTPLSTPKM